jgi:hypothetical protein
LRHSAGGIPAVTGVLAWLAHPARSQTAGEIEEAAAATVAAIGLQIELPGEPKVSGWEINLPHIGFSTLTLWLALAAAAAFFLYLFRDYLPVIGFGRSAEWTPDGGAVDDGLAGSPTQASATADDLAGQGRYVEAMHLLLFRAFAELRERLGVNFSDSLTSREILRRADLPEVGKASLKDIITRVELSHFGAYPAEAPDYSACRRSYDALMDLLYARPAHRRPGHDR